MAENNNTKDKLKKADEDGANKHLSTSGALDDEQRIKMLSPTMLVVKRFFRNRLAICGLIIIVAMFLFSFVGGWIHPYGETDTFMKKEVESAIYAGATFNSSYYPILKNGDELNSLAVAEFILAKNKGESTFSATYSGENRMYSFEEVADDIYRVFLLSPVATVNFISNSLVYTPAGDFKITDEFKDAFSKAYDSKSSEIEVGGVKYFATISKRESIVYTFSPAAVISKKIFKCYDSQDKVSYDFASAFCDALSGGKTSFTADGKSYAFTFDKTDDIFEFTASGKPYARYTNFVVTPIATNIFLSVDFIDKTLETIKDEKTEFFFNENGEDVRYTVERKDMEYTIRTMSEIDLLDTYAAPSLKHWLGTDGMGMDMLVRLMYGGRVSLMIGFVVVIIEIVIGTVIGGISGYFGSWVDTVLMRLVDTINCIPNMPLYLILGSVMSTLKVDPTLRIYLLMVLLGLTGWTGIARVVRGQILSLREQEFMTATEACGISTSRKIFKHLIPNVIPQLIVYASMGIGSVILAEATLSFLGLGVKFPYASWGNIVNAVNENFVLENYLFVWIPAGLLILITVLGFNFIGDGLRDAFDPKMKR